MSVLMKNFRTEYTHFHAMIFGLKFRQCKHIKSSKGTGNFNFAPIGEGEISPFPTLFVYLFGY